MPNWFKEIQTGLQCLVIGFGLGMFVNSCFPTPRVMVPFRRGDRVMVKTGFLAGHIGKLTDRSVHRDGAEPTYRIDFEAEGTRSERDFEEKDITLVGDWNRTAQDVRH